MASKPIECYHCRLVNFVDGTETHKRWIGDIPPVGYLQWVAKQLEADLYYLTFNYHSFDPTVDNIMKELTPKLVSESTPSELYSMDERHQALARWERLRVQLKWTPEIHAIVKFWAKTTASSIPRPAIRPCGVAARKAIWRNEFEIRGEEGDPLRNQGFTFEMVSMYEQTDDWIRKVQYENQQKMRSSHGNVYPTETQRNSVIRFR